MTALERADGFKMPASHSGLTVEEGGEVKPPTRDVTPFRA